VATTVAAHDLPLAVTGTPFTTVNVPSGDYSRIESDLTATCASAKSVQITNTNGSYNSTSTTTMAFVGSFTVGDSSTALRFELSAISNHLAGVMANGDIPIAVQAAPGGLGSLAYLSDLTPTYESSAAGLVVQDLSYFHHALKINGVSYAKGLGTVAAADIRFNIGGAFTQFLTDFGFDDEVGCTGTGVTFQVWLDGVKAYDSGVVINPAATGQISISVAGKSELRLLAIAPGDHCNVIDWANSRVVQ
jgi:hypothetical protein